MRRSKLEMYVAVLQVLSKKGPLKFTHIMYKANLNCQVLTEYLDYLIKQDIVQKQTFSGNRVFYRLTERGITVIKYFRELQSAFCIGDDLTRTINSKFAQRIEALPEDRKEIFLEDIEAAAESRLKVLERS
jgi:predicted transcriptional regulator